MGGKIKSILLLVVLMIMIYCQHSPVLHAEESKNVWGYFAEDGTDRKESGKDVSGQGIEEEKEKEDGEIEPEKGEPEEVEPEEPEPIKEYELKLEKPNGRNGYYITAPKVRLCHVSKRGCTVYRLENSGKVRAEGKLEREGDSIALSEEQFGEGTNVLVLYMEDETGDRLIEYDRIEKIILDTKAPVIDVSAPNGFDAWYQQEVWLSVKADDGVSGSGIEEISVCCGEDFIGAAAGPYGEFLVTHASEGSKGSELTITASDASGHIESVTKTLYIDSSTPKAEISGIEDYMITSQPVRAVFKITEENALREWQAETEWEDMDGRKHKLSPQEWTGNDGKKEAFLDFSEDGIYRMRLSATDMAGYLDVKEAQIIIDSHNPIIKYVDKLDGKYMKKFRWNYPRETFIEDFTTYDYEIKLDERLYAIGEEVTEEGYHVLKVEAEDSAGNRSKAKAGFTVDHTPPRIIFTDIEEGGEYEEEKSFKITLENTEDEIREIRINGDIKPLGDTGQAYWYTVRKCQDYEISVKARDKAGNETESVISFQVFPKETLLQKAVEPVKRLFLKEATRQNPEKKTDLPDDAENKNPVVPVAVCGLGGVGAAVFYRKFH